MRGKLVPIGFLCLLSAFAQAQVCTNTPMGFFIRSLYRDILEKEATEADLRSWLNKQLSRKELVIQILREAPSTRHGAAAVPKDLILKYTSPDYGSEAMAAMPRFNREGEVCAGYGVNIHWITQTPLPAERELKRFRELGINLVRVGLHSNAANDFSQYDQLLEVLERNNVRWLAIINIRDQEEVEKILTHYRGRGIIWEASNEPNNAEYWDPPNAADYALHANLIGGFLKSHYPNETLAGVSGACGPVHLAHNNGGIPCSEFMDAVFKLGPLTYFDAVSVHPYRQLIPETIESDAVETFHGESFPLLGYPGFRKLISKFSKGKDIPLITSEWGYQGANAGETKQAQFAVRQALIQFSLKVPISIWYDWREGGSNNFGILNQDLSIKAAYTALQVMGNSLRGYQFAGRLPSAAEDYILRFERRGELPRFVAWSSKDPHVVKMTLAPKARYDITGMQGAGAGVARTDKDGVVSLEVSAWPFYLTPKP